MTSDYDIEILEQVVEETKEKHYHQIVLFNDDVNTFDHVIDTLIRVCEHEPLQAEQCAMLVHYKGKCGVKTGDYKDLEPRCTALLDAGLSAEIQ
ncbi:ATP-dependent Clp protease adaptor ClpS [Aquimarina agarilytica]|uniref:ATP-dependent Clp protease adaptor ClpS n=1 Tax=Aquimarina agarilytica TaxID=1087449 RepID=UPI0002F05271|nr:ATP-dependent Clp protease adaptor ClpS [Aquimarina agarilytica]